MLGQNSSGNDDFLSQEIKDSQTNENIQNDILKTLEKSNEIKARLGNNPEIEEKYERIRLAAVGSLKELRLSISHELGDFKDELEGKNETLSQGEITQEEHDMVIVNEMVQLEELERQSYINDFGDTLEDQGVLEKYGVFQIIFMYPEISNELIISLTNEIKDTGKISLQTLSTLNTIFSSIFEFDEVLHQESLLTIQHVLETGDASILEENYILPEIVLGSLRNILDKNPELIQKALFDIDLKNDLFGGVCSPDAVIFIDYLRGNYLESKSIVLEENMRTYYINQDIHPDTLEGLDELITSLSSGGCSVDYISQIKAFNERNGLTLNFTPDDAQSIIGSVIDVRKTENEIKLMRINDEISQITHRSNHEIRSIINSNDPGIIGEFLDNFRENSRIREIEGEIFELLDIRRDIRVQTDRFDEVTTNAEIIYRMSEAERVEYRRLLMSFTGSSINIDISKDIHRNYVLERPKERLILLNSAEDLASILPEANEMLRNQEERQEIELEDINPDFLTHPEVLEFFISQDSLRSQVVGKLPIHVFQSQELGNIIFQGSKFLWKSLFQNIYSANHSEDAIRIMGHIISDNTENIEGNIIYLRNAVPREVYFEVLGEEFSEDYNTIQGINAFRRNIDFILNPPLTESISGEMISPIASGMEETSSSYDEGIVVNNLLQFIRVGGLTNDALDSMRGLIDGNQGLNLISQILPMLNPTNSQHMLFAKYAVSIQENGSSRASNFIYLNAATKSQSEIIQEMGRYGIGEFKPSLIQYITSQKLFAQYLLGYTSKVDNNIRDLRNNSRTQYLRTRIENNDTVENLSEREAEALNIFFQRTKELEGIIDSIEGNLDSINEEQRNSISNILQEAGLNIPIIQSIIPEDFQNLRLVDIFLIRVGEELDKIPNTNDASIRAVISQILAVNTTSAEGRVNAIDGQGILYTPNLILSLQEHGFLIPRSTEEHPLIDYNSLTENYLEIYRRENISPEDLDNVEVIQEYLLSLGLTQAEANSMIQGLTSRVRLEVQQRGEKIYGNQPLNTPWRSNLENPPGLYAGTQQQIRQEIERGEYQYIKYNGETSQETITQPYLTPKYTNSQNQNNTYQQITSELGLTQQEAQSITPEELKLIATNETVKDNFIGFRTTLQELNMESIWQFRNQIFKAIGSIDFNIMDGNYIGENELNIFLSKVTYATLGSELVPELKSTPSNLDATKQVIRRENNVGFLGQVDQSAVGEGGGIIEKVFREKFAPKDSGLIGFEISKFKEALTA